MIKSHNNVQQQERNLAHLNAAMSGPTQRSTVNTFNNAQTAQMNVTR